MRKPLAYLRERWRLIWCDLDPESNEGHSATRYAEKVKAKLRAEWAEVADAEPVSEAARGGM